jgi:hypothetical protein
LKKKLSPKLASGQIIEVKRYATNAFLWQKFLIMPKDHYKEVIFIEVTNLTDFLKVSLNMFFMFTRHIAQV